jgi:hypothetical protein
MKILKGARGGIRKAKRPPGWEPKTSFKKDLPRAIYQSVDERARA